MRGARLLITRRGASRLPPVAGGKRRASGSGLYFQGGIDRRRKYRAPQQGRYAELIFEDVRHKDKTESCRPGRQCELKKYRFGKPRNHTVSGFCYAIFQGEI